MSAVLCPYCFRELNYKDECEHCKLVVKKHERLIVPPTPPKMFSVFLFLNHIYSLILVVPAVIFFYDNSKSLLGILISFLFLLFGIAGWTYASRFVNSYNFNLKKANYYSFKIHNDIIKLFAILGLITIYPSGVGLIFILAAFIQYYLINHDASVQNYLPWFGMKKVR